jgi:chromosome partitioning protein
VAAAQFCVSEAAGLMHILPGSPDMPRHERQIVASFLPRSDINAAYETAAIRMGEQFRFLLDDFDFVLIDCPPGLTLFSEAAIRAADGIVVPTLPNEISFAAIDHLRSEIARARPDTSFDDLLVGTVVSKVRQKNGSTNHRTHIESIERLLDRVAPEFQLLKPYLPYCRELEGATWRDNESRVSFAMRYGQSSAMVERLVQEFAGRCGALMARRQHA